uniref:Uncharacterized protein n=1 Tax=Caldimicrobium thiodismutans TaxID=1653476 RepID=A0A832GRJ5_9BACT
MGWLRLALAYLWLTYGLTYAKFQKLENCNIPLPPRIIFLAGFCMAFDWLRLTLGLTLGLTYGLALGIQQNPLFF